MKTDSILQELYATLTKMMQTAGNDFNRLFDQMCDRQPAYEAVQLELQSLLEAPA